MLSKLLVLTTSMLVVFLPKAQAGFVQRLLKEEPGTNMNTLNLQEYYGRLKREDDEDMIDNNSEAYLTMLLSYEY